MSTKSKTWSLSFRYILAVILFMGFVAFLLYAHEAVKMFTIAAFVAYLISPAVNFLVGRTSMSRKAAVKHKVT